MIRDLGAVLVKGIRPREIFAQYMAKAWGPSGGRDLNIHFGDMEKRLHWPNLTFGRHDSRDDRNPARGTHAEKKFVAVAYIGDGGMSTGAFHEGLNFAAVQRLPLIVVAEHNHYAYSTPTSLANGSVAIWLKKRQVMAFRRTSSTATTSLPVTKSRSRRLIMRDVVAARF